MDQEETFLPCECILFRRLISLMTIIDRPPARWVDEKCATCAWMLSRCRNDDDLSLGVAL